MNSLIYQDIKEKILYVVMDDAHFLDEVAAIIATAFLSEPMVKALRISFKEMLSATKQICNNFAGQELSLIALNDKRQVVGGIISYDTRNEPPRINVSDKFIPLFTLLDELEKGENADFNEPVLCQFMIGINSAFSGRNIGRNLIRLNNQLAKINGFKAVKASVTGPVSQHIFAAQGYKIAKSIFYKNFSGKKDFNSINECESCQLVYKKI